MSVLDFSMLMLADAEDFDYDLLLLNFEGLYTMM